MSSGISTVRAGASVRASASRHYADAARRGAFVLALVAVALAVASRGAFFSSLVLVLVAAGLGRKAHGVWKSGNGYRAGAISEERVGAILAELAPPWRVEHDVLKRGGGNVDHVVHSPRVTFAIDTKRSRWKDADLGQARRHAEWAERHFGSRRSVVPVICVERSSKPAVMVDGVYIVGASELVRLLLDFGSPLTPLGIPMPARGG
jgi:Nuclease-related domain